MQNTECHLDMRRFRQLLAEGCCAGRQMLTTLRSIQDVLPPEPMGRAAGALAEDVLRGRAPPKIEV
ncbi:MAG: hypothetical protein A2Z18_07425 [Armatimonadetes bacterium RBG_16_58_9]|nr:MAG: hypothetical protein A2Z18_07425 [Armatimonadetes bacterium RBG_16_58_9]